MKTYTHEEVIAMLRRIKGNRKQKEFAAEIGIRPDYFSMVMGGNLRPPACVLKFLGLRGEKKTTWTYFEDGRSNGKSRTIK